MHLKTLKLTGVLKLEYTLTTQKEENLRVYIHKSRSAADEVREFFQNAPVACGFPVFIFDFDSAFAFDSNYGKPVLRESQVKIKTEMLELLVCLQTIELLLYLQI